MYAYLRWISNEASGKSSVRTKNDTRKPHARPGREQRKEFFRAGRGRNGNGHARTGPEWAFTRDCAKAPGRGSTQAPKRSASSVHARNTAAWHCGLALGLLHLASALTLPQLQLQLPFHFSRYHRRSRTPAVIESYSPQILFACSAFRASQLPTHHCFCTFRTAPSALLHPTHPSDESSCQLERAVSTPPAKRAGPSPPDMPTRRALEALILQGELFSMLCMLSAILCACLARSSHLAALLSGCCEMKDCRQAHLA